MNKIIKWLSKRQILLCIIISLLLNLIIEMLNRKSVLLGLKHLIFTPHIFLYNMMFIFCTLIISFLFVRRYFVMIIMSAIWLALGITNRVLLTYRTTPLGAIDFKIIKSTFNIMTVYLNVFEIISVIALFTAAIAVIMYIYFKVPKYKPNYKHSVIAIVTSVLITALTTIAFLNTNYISTSFRNLADSYKDYGFIYCFACTMVDRGIDRPEDYSKDAMDDIITEIEDDAGLIDDEWMNEQESEQKKEPNIIFLQLESFFDVTHMKNLTYSENPTPIFRHLKDEYSSGFLTVPMIGAGTANTEFEIISGMSLEFFGPGEYPYTTVLQESTCETVNYNLKELGFKAHAIHNHTGTFYDRHKVYSQLGFDTFTSLEYMNSVEYNQVGWAKDSVLTNEIMKHLTSTEERDIVYAISVQGHGKYPDDVVDESQRITVEGLEEDNKIAFEYYVNQISEMDDFIGGLVSTLESYNEPVVLIMYGDHLPSFDISNEELDNNNIFQTEYVIWDNIGLKEHDKDLYTYQLTSSVLTRVGISNGVLTKFHASDSEKEGYMHELEMLEHDMLYGDKIIYNGVIPYEPTQLKMGIEDINIHTISTIEKSAYIIGKNFTKWSDVYVNGKKKDTRFIDGNILVANNVELKSGDIVTICQVADDKTVLSTSDEFIVE